MQIVIAFKQHDNILKEAVMEGLMSATSVTRDLNKTIPISHYMFVNFVNIHVHYTTIMTLYLNTYAHITHTLCALCV